MTDAELMMDLFQGSDLAHGRSELTQKVSAKGKHETKSWLEKRPATQADWQNHLNGVSGLGIPPLNSKNEVMWGAIDVDVYQGLSIEALNQKIHGAGLPLVICRSKSGGPHIYLHLKEWIPASEMIEKLDTIAGWLGFGTSEIFPKQAMIAQSGDNPDYGSWINMPYFGGTRFLRYALDRQGQALVTIKAYHDFVTERRLTKQQFADLKVPEPEQLFPDGPPCLNQIFAERPTENRNILLANAAVYAKKADPENWKARLDKYNAHFAEPLPSDEVEALKKSYGKRDYHYQCQKQPLCSFCNSSLCRKRKFGVGGGGNDIIPANRSLTKIDTNPPTWYLDLQLPEGKAIRISLTTEQLQSSRQFQRRCMETIHRMPPAIADKEWQPIVDALMKHVTVISVPPEMSTEGLFKEIFWDFLNNRATAESWENLIRGVPYRDNANFYFRMKDLMKAMQDQRFTVLKQHEITAILRNDFNAQKGFRSIAGRGTNYFFVPIPSHEPTQPLAVPEFAAGY